MAMLLGAAGSVQAADKKPNILVLMQDDTGWFDFGCYNGGRALGHPTPHVDQLAKEGAMFTSWYGQASCTAGRASFITGRIPIRSALSIVVAPGDENSLRKETPTIAEFFKKNGYQTYFSGKWHLGDKPDSYPIEHGFDEMKSFGAYYPGVYTYSLHELTGSIRGSHPTTRSFRKSISVREHVRVGRCRGPACQEGHRDHVGLSRPNSIRTQTQSCDRLHQAACQGCQALLHGRQLLQDAQPQPTPRSSLAGKSHLGRYSDSLLELDDNIGRIMDVIRAEAPDTIVIIDADNGAWQDAYPDAGTHPFRGEKGSAFEGWLARSGHHVVAGTHPGGRAVRRNDVAHRLLGDAGCHGRASRRRRTANGRVTTASRSTSTALTTAPTSSARRKHSARDSWIYIDGENFMGARFDIGGDPKNDDSPHRVEVPLYGQGHLAWPETESGFDRLALLPHHGSVREIRHGLQRCDVVAHAEDLRRVSYAGEDNGWVLALIYPVIIDFDKSDHEVSEHQAISRAARPNDLIPDLQHPENPVPLVDPSKVPQVKGGGD